jgi:hypothetical protein
MLGANFELSFPDYRRERLRITNTRVNVDLNLLGNMNGKTSMPDVCACTYNTSPLHRFALHTGYLIQLTAVIAAEGGCPFPRQQLHWMS